MNNQGTNYNMVNMMKMSMQANNYNQQYIRPPGTVNNNAQSNYNPQFNMNNPGMMMNNYKPQNYQQTFQGYQQPPQNYQQTIQGYQQPPQNYQQTIQGYQQPSQTYQQQNQMNLKPAPFQNTFFVYGKIGNKTIAQEDRQSFLNNLRDTNWTQVSLYKNSKNAQVKTSFAPKQGNSISDDHMFEYASFDRYYIELEPALSNFNFYLNDIQQGQSGMHETVQNKKNTFLSNIQGETDADFNTILYKIKQNRSYILSKDEQLYKKVANILPFIATDTSNQNQQQQFQQQQPQPQFQQQQQMNMPPNSNNMYYGNNNMNVPRYNY